MDFCDIFFFYFLYGDLGNKYIALRNDRSITDGDPFRAIHFKNLSQK